MKGHMSMLIAGLIKTTLLDFPEHICATVFFGGCNFRCPFCHNGEFVTKKPEEITDVEGLLAFLKKRAGILEGVCLTGGEPTLNEELPKLISKIKELGYMVKLDTNGSNPGMLGELIKEHMLSYVAMDVKNSWEKYAFTAGFSDGPLIEGSDPFERFPVLKDVRESIDILRKGAIPYEFRTTVIKDVHTGDDIRQIASYITPFPDAKYKGAYYIQNFVESDNVIKKGCFSGFADDEIKTLIKDTGYEDIRLRGVG